MTRTLVHDSLKTINQTITLNGWVDSLRDHGQLVFINLRDHTGIIQCLGNKTLKSLHPEDVISVTGKVTQRQPENINPDLATGTIELSIDQFQLLNPAKPLPFPIDSAGHEIDTDLRLKYRYLDLRRRRLQQNLRTRSTYVQAIREYLFQKHFTEIETPLLTKSTPEGSRDFVVPSRIQPGKFFALPQSPQQYKQLLMTGGFDRYFQIARCLRDEDPRADRAFEHTQVDLELSFVEREDVMSVVESMILHAVKAIGFGNQILSTPFPVYTYQKAMAEFGADKFDLRTQAQKEANELAFAWVIDFPFFEKTPEGKWTFTHNPFSQPKPEHLNWHLSGQNLDQILTTQYDLVCNGYEIGGGSLRAYQPQVLQATYRNMGYDDVYIQAHIGHMLEAFSLGTPPHGGCAHGFERLLMAIFQEPYIREVQAFPQTGKGTTSVMQAPNALTHEQLAELGLVVTQKKHQSVYDALIDLLQTRQIKYHHYEHQPVNSSEEAAKARGDVSLSQGAKAMLLKVKKDYLLFILPADLQSDLKALRHVLGTSQVKLASLADVENITGLKPGAVPPFGSLMGLKTLVDQRLANNTEIAFNAGRHDRSIRMNFQDFINLEQPQLVDLSE